MKNWTKSWSRRNGKQADEVDWGEMNRSTGLGVGRSGDSGDLGDSSGGGGVCGRSFDVRGPDQLVGRAGRWRLEVQQAEREAWCPVRR